MNTYLIGKIMIAAPLGFVILAGSWLLFSSAWNNAQTAKGKVKITAIALGIAGWFAVATYFLATGK